MNDKITALILHFRTKIQTISCIESLLNEGLREVFIVDNSEDNGKSIQAMAEDLNNLEKRGIRINLLTRNYNMGFAAGVNYGLSEIRKNFLSHVLLINSDSLLEKGAINGMTKLLNDNALTFPLIRDESLHTQINYYQKTFGLFLKTNNAPASFPFIGGCCWLIHKNFTQENIFDEDFFFYGEDIFFGFNLINKNYKYQECKEAVVWHEGSASAKNGSLFYEYNMSRAHYLLGIKLSSNIFEKFLYIGCRLFYLPLRATIRCFRFGSITPWKGLLLATLDIARGKRRSFTPPA